VPAPCTILSPELVPLPLLFYLFGSAICSIFDIYNVFKLASKEMSLAPLRASLHISRVRAEVPLILTDDLEMALRPQH